MANLERPNDKPTEEALLGSLLINPDMLEYVSPLITSDVFFWPKHGWVYETIVDLTKKGDAVDVMTVATELERRGNLKKLGGPSELTRYANETPISLHAETYAVTLRDLYDRRVMIDTCGAMAGMAYRGESPVTDIYIESLELFEKAEPTGKPVRSVGGKEIGTHMLNAQIQVSQEYQKDMKGKQIGWPWESMRGYLKGWRKGQPAVLIAEGGAGKTAVCMEIGGHNAQNGALVFYAHTEDEPEILLLRRLSTLSGIPFNTLESGNWGDLPLIELDFGEGKIQVPQKVLSTVVSTKSWSGEIHFIDVGGMTIPEACYALRRKEKEVGTPDAVIYDWFLDHEPRPGKEQMAVKLILDLQDLKSYCRKRTRLLVAMQTGKKKQGQHLTAYDAHWTSAAAHYGKIVMGLKRERETINGQAIGAFKPTMEVFISKANLDLTGTFKLIMKGDTFHIYEPPPHSIKTTTLPTTPDGEVTVEWNG